MENKRKIDSGDLQTPSGNLSNARSASSDLQTPWKRVQNTRCNRGFESLLRHAWRVKFCVTVTVTVFACSFDCLSNVVDGNELCNSGYRVAFIPYFSFAIVNTRQKNIVMLKTRQEKPLSNNFFTRLQLYWMSLAKWIPERTVNGFLIYLFIYL